MFPCTIWTSESPTKGLLVGLDLGVENFNFALNDFFGRKTLSDIDSFVAAGSGGDGGADADGGRDFLRDASKLRGK